LGVSWVGADCQPQILTGSANAIQDDIEADQNRDLVALDELISLGPDSRATNTLDLAAREALGGAIHLVFLAALVVAVLAFGVTALAPRGRIAQRGQEAPASAAEVSGGAGD